MKPILHAGGDQVAVVVNDDPIHLNLLVELAKRAGFSPLAFSSADEALERLTAEVAGQCPDPVGLPALIITDLYMPGIDGWRFCRLLRSAEYSAFNKVPIIVISSTYAGSEPRRIAEELGAQAFLSPPVDGRTFAALVASIMRGEGQPAKLRALVVEDSRVQAGFLEKALAGSGYLVDIACTLEEAEALGGRGAYDVAVIDYHLPDGEGDAILHSLRKLRPECVCIIMTTDPNPKLALRWMRQGAAAYIRKPFDAEYLLELCEKARKERALLRVQDLLEERTRQLNDSHDKLAAKVTELNRALEQIKTLHGILPICMHCKKIRNDKGYWEQVDVYLSQRTEAEFSHGVCADCLKTHYPDYADDEGDS